MNALPPISIAVSGNRCGGCCKRSSIRPVTPPPHYMVVFTDKFIAVSPHCPPVEMEKAAEKTISQFSSHLQKRYSVDLKDLPNSALSPSKPPSVAQLRMIEWAAIGYAEGVKKAKGSSSTVGTPLAPKSSSEE